MKKQEFASEFEKSQRWNGRQRAAYAIPMIPSYLATNVCTIQAANNYADMKFLHDGQFSVKTKLQVLVSHIRPEEVHETISKFAMNFFVFELKSNHKNGNEEQIQRVGSQK